jgi:hypothetical protein
MMLTIYEAFDIQNTVNRLRKRLATTSTFAKTARAAFKSQDEAWMEIPSQVDDYNHEMGAVDRADQYRANHPGYCRIRRGGWHALWVFIFNIVLCNSYLLSSIKLQDEFRTLLFKHLFQAGASSRKRKWVEPSHHLDAEHITKLCKMATH